MPGSNRTPRGSGRDRTGLHTDDINLISFSPENMKKNKKNKK